MFWPFWLMIVSTATAVLPVWRSPMISSRWPRDRDHGIDGLQARLHRLRHRLTPDDARGHFFDLVGELRFDRTLAVDRLPQGIDHAPEQFGANRHFEDAASSLDRVAFGDVLEVAEHHGTDRVALQVEREPVGVAGKLQHFALHRVGQTVDTADAVGNRHHGALVAGLGR